MTAIKTYPSLLRELVLKNKYVGPDAQLYRYSRSSELRDYIDYCCRNTLYIEAYNLTLQYIHNIVIAFVDESNKNTQETEASTIIKSLNAVSLIDDKVFEEYKKAKRTRIDFTHKIIRNPDVLDKLKKQKPEAHSKVLLSLIDDFEEAFLNLFKHFPYKFNLKHLVKNQRNNLLGDIIANRISKRITSSLEGLDNEEWSKEFKKRFNEEFIREIGKYMRIEET